MRIGEPKGPVQKIAQGLLGFFQLKEQGNPTVILDSLSPGLELKDWYLATSNEIPNLSVRDITNNQTGFFGFNAAAGPIIVPPREWWWINRFTAYAGIPLATDTLQIASAYRTVTSQQDFVVGPVSPVITGNNRALASTAGGFFVPPGTELGVFVCEARTLTAITVIGAVDFTRLPI